MTHYLDLLKSQDLQKDHLYELTEFEKQLIDLVKQNPDIDNDFSKMVPTDDLNPRGMILENRARYNVWREFARKWTFRVHYCKYRWTKIKIAYLEYLQLKEAKMIPMPKKYIKFMDDRLSFLDPLYYEMKDSGNNETQSNLDDIETSVNNVKDDVQPPKKKMCPSHDLSPRSQDFTDFEKQLIAHAKTNPVFYDRTFRGNASQIAESKLRIELVSKLWKDFGDKIGVSGHFCHRHWNKMRLTYFHARKSINDINQFSPLSKYLDKTLDFLEPMYEYIKNNSIKIFDKMPDSIVDDDRVDEINYVDSEWNGEVYCWSEFDLSIIDFVKKHSVLYDPRMMYGENKERGKIIDRLWNELAINLNALPGDCTSHWNNIRKYYEDYQKIKARMNQDDREKQEKRCEKLYFLSQIYKNPDSTIKPDSGEAIVRNNDKEQMTHIPEKEDMCEIKEKPWENVLNIQSEKTNDLKDAPDKISDKKPMSSDMNHSTMSNSDFFREIGKHVADHFPEHKQKEIRLKSWALVTQLELAMLQED